MTETTEAKWDETAFYKLFMPKYITFSIEIWYLSFEINEYNRHLVAILLHM